MPHFISKSDEEKTPETPETPETTSDQEDGNQENSLSDLFDLIDILVFPEDEFDRDFFERGIDYAFSRVLHRYGIDAYDQMSTDQKHGCVCYILKIINDSKKAMNDFAKNMNEKFNDENNNKYI